MAQSKIEISSHLKKRDRFKKLLLLGLGAILIGATIFDWLKKSEQQSVENSAAEPELSQSANNEYDVQEFGGEKDNILYYPTPEVSFFEEKFCKGAVNSTNCSKKPLHPFFESMAAYGMKIPNPPKNRKVLRSETFNRVAW